MLSPKNWKHPKKNRLLRYLEEDSILPKSQYGSKEILGTKDLQAQLTRDIHT